MFLLKKRSLKARAIISQTIHGSIFTVLYRSTPVEPKLGCQCLWPRGRHAEGAPAIASCCAGPTTRVPKDLPVLRFLGASKKSFVRPSAELFFWGVLKGRSSKKTIAGDGSFRSEGAVANLKGTSRSLQTCRKDMDLSLPKLQLGEKHRDR